MVRVMINESKNVLSDNELKRYQRQIILFGKECQIKLKKAKVAVVGVGGLGSPIAFYLTAMGFGFIKLIDFDKVSLSNLNRQILHWTTDIGKVKVLSALEKLKKLNPEVEIIPIKERLTKENAEQLLSDVDICFDALDNWESKLLLNEICVKLNKILIHAGVRGMYGQMLVIIPGKTPCLQCLINGEKIKTAEKLPILGVTPAILGTLQVLEATKIITGYGKPQVGNLIVFDGFSTELELIHVKKDPNCPICSKMQGQA